MSDVALEYHCHTVLSQTFALRHFLNRHQATENAPTVDIYSRIFAVSALHAY